MTIRLLIVEDEEAILAAMSEYFSACGFEVDGARELADAEARLESESYGAVIADLRLGGGAGTEGLDVLSEARRRCPSTRTILLSAHRSTDLEGEARRRGVDAFLPKPQSLADVARLVRHLIGAEEPERSGRPAAPSRLATPPDLPASREEPRLAEDAELVRRCLAGDGRAWEALVRRYARIVHGIAHRSGLAREDCEDVMQTVFLRAFRGLELLDRPQSVGFWLGTIARREAWKARLRLARPGRGRGRSEPWAEVPTDALAELPATDGSPDEGLELAERMGLVHLALDRLDERCRQLLHELFFRDPAPSYDEAAVTLRMARGSLGPSRSRCLQRLGRSLRQVGFQP